MTVAFINRIIYDFDRIKYGNIELEEAIEPDDTLKERRDKIVKIPKDLRQMLFPISTMAKFFLATGVGRPKEEQRHDQDMKNSIEESCRTKLKEYGQLVVPLMSPRTQLMSYIFQEVYSKASLQKKELIIQLMNDSDKSLSTSITNSVPLRVQAQYVLSTVIKNRFFRIIATLFLTYQVALIAKFVLSFPLGYMVKGICSAARFFTPYTPTIILKGASPIITTIQFLFQVKVQLGILSLLATSAIIADKLRIRGPLVDRAMKIMLGAGVICALPAYLVMYSLVLVGVVSIQAQDKIGNSLRHLSNRALAKHYELEGMKAHDVWMRLTSNNPAQIPAQFA